MLGTAVVAVAAVAIVFMITSGNDDGEGAAASSPTSQTPAVDSSSTSLPASTASASSESSSSSTPISEVTATVPGPATVSSASWETIEGVAFGGTAPQSLTDIAVVGTGYVAVGSSGPGFVWTSPDAVSWISHRAPGLETAQLLHIEPATDGTLVGVGHSLTDPSVFATWTSPDGITWAPQAPPDGGLPAGAQRVSDLAAYPGGFVAVGLVSNDGDIDAAWWTSPDGINWTAGTISEPGVQQMLGVAVSDGLMVAAGETRPDTGIWTAPLGGTFSRIDHPSLTISVSDFDPSNTAARVFAWKIAAGGPGFVAVGADQTTANTSMAAVWTSADGAEWLRLGNETGYTPNMAHANFTGRPPWTVMDTVINSSGTLIVAGRTGTPGDPDLIIWESTDGFTWRQGPVGLLPQAQRPLNSLAHNDKLIIVGITNGITQTATSEGAAWIATPEPNPPRIGTWREVPQFEQVQSGIFGVHASTDRIIGLGLGETEAQLGIWESTDGVRWSRLAQSTAPSTPIRFNGIDSIDGLFLLSGQDPSPAIWWSSDLSTWQKATDPAGPDGFISGVRRVQGQLIAYGASRLLSPSAVAIWLSSDGRTWTDSAAAQTIGSGLAVGVVDFTGQSVLAVGDLALSGVAIWTSPNGQDWMHIADDPLFAEFRPSAIVTFEDRLVIAGSVPTAGVTTAAMLVTADLESWDLLVLDGATAPAESRVTGISVIGSRLVVTGHLGAVVVDNRPALWSTQDLTFWTRAEPLPVAGRVNDQVAIPGGVNAVIRVGDRLVAVGYADQADGYSYAAAWTSDNP